jgi:DNA-binding response OmpR family regulator
MTQTDNQPQTILVIDDEPHNLRLMLEYLEIHHFRVLVSQDGASGLQRARYAQPDLILLDVILPDMDGFELCQQLKADPAIQAIPVIFMTVLTLPEDKVKAFTMGGVDYVTKPVQWEEVLARVTTHLQIRELTRRLQAAHATLEKAVAERTAALERTNQLLQQQIIDQGGAAKGS